MDNPFAILFILFLLLVGAVFIWLFVLVGKAADKRGRSSGGWVVFALIFSPFAAWIVLLCLGDTDAKRREKIIEEEELRQRVARRYADNAPRQYAEPPQPTTDHERYKPQSTANPLGKTVNDLYKK